MLFLQVYERFALMPIVVAAGELRCRPIADTDIGPVATLLARGFRKRSHKFWLKALDLLGRREPPAPLPKYGYLLESNGVAVGVLLVISAKVQTGDLITTRCNVSSWYTEPEFRAYAPLLVSRAIAAKELTYLNVSPAPNTLPIIEAQGFSRYSNGIFVAVPIVALRFGQRLQVAEAPHRPSIAFDQADQDLLLQHMEWGCVSLWCVSSERAYPFVFRLRVVEGIIPCAQLVYCRDIEDFVRCAGPVGRFLARRGRLFVLLDANGPVPGLVGKYFPGKMPKYFKGRHRPRLGDLAHTEIAVLGV